MRASDPGLQHSTTPNRNSALTASIVHGARFPVATDAAEFDIDDLASTDLYCFPCIVSGMDRFIKADWSLDLLLKLGMVDDVFVMERLLEHHHVVSIHPFENVDIRQRISRVRVAHEPNVRKCRPHLPDHVHIPA